MAKGGSKKPSKNISFKQTSKVLKALRQAKVSSGFRRNIPYNMKHISQKIIQNKIRKISTKTIQKNPLGKLKKYARRIYPNRNVISKKNDGGLSRNQK